MFVGRQLNDLMRAQLSYFLKDYEIMGTLEIFGAPTLSWNYAQPLTFIIPSKLHGTLRIGCYCSHLTNGDTEASGDDDLLWVT